MMKDELIKYMKDCSTEDEFCFKFLCSSCGTWWYSKPIPFSHSGEKRISENKKVIHAAIYMREWTIARNAVLDDAVRRSHPSVIEEEPGEHATDEPENKGEVVHRHRFESHLEYAPKDQDGDGRP